MQYSKFLPIVTGILFMVVLFNCITSAPTSTIGYSILVAAITTSGGVFGSSVIWYMKKAQAENIYKLKKDLYKTVNAEQIKYAEAVLQLKKDFNATDEDVKKIDFDSQLDEFKNNAVMDMQNSVDRAMNDAAEDPKISTY